MGIVALIQESNTFLHARTGLAEFERDVLLRGEAVRDHFAGAHHEIGGFFAGLEEGGLEAVPLFAARALPYGVVSDEAMSQLVGMMLEDVERAGELDGILAAPHGATSSESQPDADGFWLRALRDRVGGSLPIIATADPHANLSQRMVDATNAMIAYQTNPHIDQRERGVEAARLMVRTLNLEVNPTQAGAFPPMAINIECQDTSRPPCRPWYEKAERLREDRRVLSSSLMLGFPYGDTAEMGSSAMVVTDNDPQLARRLANELAADLWERREQFIGNFISVEEAVVRAGELEGPVCLLDMGDNVGGGSPGDSTVLAQALHQRAMGGAFVCLCDEESERQAEAAGAGARVRLRAGGKSIDSVGGPLEAEFVVVGCYDGKFKEPDARHGGFTDFDQGRSAVVRTDAGLTLMLTSRRMVPFSMKQLTSCQLDPASFRILVAKGVHAPVAAYREVCKSFIRVDTPGVTTADIRRLNYRRRRRPMFPFERDARWKI